MDLIEVTAQFDTKGRITPINFILNGGLYRVEGIGRRWETKNEKHILVMSAGNRTYHLIYDKNTCFWKYYNDEDLQVKSNI